MTLTGIILLLLLGLLFLILEILVLPGTTVLGFAGGILMVIGVWVAFSLYGLTTGLYVLGGSSVVTIAAVVMAFRAGTWNRFTLHKKLTGQVNTFDQKVLAAGTIGVAVSRLAPMGKGEFNGEYYEVTTNGEFVDATTKITIVAVSKNQITVKPIKS
jgi:membrane-bound ClpP family serine protease